MKNASFSRVTASAILATSLVSAAPLRADDPALFDTPDAPVTAMVTALQNRSREALIAVFGSDAEDLLFTGEAPLDRIVWTGFLAEFERGHFVQTVYGKYAVLLLGDDNWPFPIPLQKNAAGQWYFDAEEGREEILLRRIGRNELAAIETLGSYVEVQAVYRSQDRDGDGVMEFASSIISTPGTKDGLYWPGDDSPAGEFIAQAEAKGYSIGGQDFDPQPYGGYLFKLLTKQGNSAPGGAMNYLVNGHQIAGHAMLAHPATYGSTGIMSFLIAESGTVYQADLGQDTATAVQAIDSFDPGAGWTIATE